MIARDQLKSIIDRILRLKEEQDAIGEDVREVYAEAKSNGYDKTALGRVVSHLRKVAKKGAAEVAEADTIFDLYLSTYEGPSHTHAHAREEPNSAEPKPTAVIATLVRPEAAKPAASAPAEATGAGEAENRQRSRVSASPTNFDDDSDDMAIPASLRRYA